MKGIELPINILVIIAVAVIVLLGVIALYFSGFMGPAGVMTQNSALNAACKIVMSNVSGCQGANPTLILFDGTYNGIGKFDANGDGHICPNAADAFCVAGKEDTLQALCAKYFGVTTSTPPTATEMSNCRKECGCPG